MCVRDVEFRNSYGSHVSFHPPRGCWESNSGPQSSGLAAVTFTTEPSSQLSTSQELGSQVCPSCGDFPLQPLVGTESRLVA